MVRDGFCQGLEADRHHRQVGDSKGRPRFARGLLIIAGQAAIRKECRRPAAQNAISACYICSNECLKKAPYLEPLVKAWHVVYVWYVSLGCIRIYTNKAGRLATIHIS